MEDNKQQINVNVSAEVVEGTYSNLAIISHSQSEFIVDFIRILPGVQKANVKSRIVLTPDNAKRLLFALNDNIQKFEAEFGEIKIAKSATPAAPVMTFKGSKGEA